MSNLSTACISGTRDVKTSRYARGRGNHVSHCPLSCFYQTTKTLSSWWLFSSNVCRLNAHSPTGGRRQEWDRVIGKATISVRLVLSIDIGTDSPKSALCSRYNEKDGHRAQTTQFIALRRQHHPVCMAIFHSHVSLTQRLYPRVHRNFAMISGKEQHLYIYFMKLRISLYITYTEYSRTPLIRKPVIRIPSHPDRLDPSGKFLENSTKLTCLEITGYLIKCSTVLWHLELQIRRVRNV
jgi:hypothetical protein